MERQLFVVTLEVPLTVGRCFSKVESEWMANMICNAIQTKSRSFMGPVPFKITVEQVNEAASASGEMKEYRSEEFPDIEAAIHEQPKASVTLAASDCHNHS